MNIPKAFFNEIMNTVKRESSSNKNGLRNLNKANNRQIKEAILIQLINLS